MYMYMHMYILICVYEYIDVCVHIQSDDFPEQTVATYMFPRHRRIDPEINSLRGNVASLGVVGIVGNASIGGEEKHVG